MENDRPKKRLSLLPQRSTSIASNAKIDDDSGGKLAPPAKPRRDISPSKLPVGGARRIQPVRQANATTRQPGHRAQQSSTSLAKDDLPTITSMRSATTASNLSPKKPNTIGKTAGFHAKQPSQSSRPISSHKSTASAADARAPSAIRRASAGKESRPQSATAVRVSSKTLANVKVQRPVSAAPARPPSPKKAVKPPLVSKFALLTTPPTPAAKPVQDAKVELLHLHCLHKETHATMTQWTLSAKEHYEKHFRRLIQLEEDLKVTEMEFIKQQNATGLIDWCREVCATTGESKTKVLSSIISEMWLIVSPGGRYSAAVSAFEDWNTMVEKELDHRLHDCHVDIMEGLGDGWKAEVDALMSALCRMSDDLESLGPALEPSDLARCINVLMTMLANMLEELVLIRDIESKLVDREGDFVKGRIEGLSAQVSSVS